MTFSLLQILFQEWWNWNTKNLCNLLKWKSSDVNASNLKPEPTLNPCHTYILSMRNAWKQWDSSTAIMNLKLSSSFFPASSILMKPLQQTNHGCWGRRQGRNGVNRKSKEDKKKYSSEVFVTILECLLTSNITFKL